MVDPEDPALSVRRQCGLLGIPRSGLYYGPKGESADNLRLMRLIDETYTKWPFYGVRRMSAWLKRQGEAANHKRVRRLMRIMGLEAIYPKKRLSAPGTAHKRYPYLLAGVCAARPNHVWSADITYVRMLRGFMYLVAVLDWHSRHVLSWALSSGLDAGFCIGALEAALALGQPEIFNTEQGAQFTDGGFTSLLESRGAAVSMDGRGRAFDNIFTERLWRSVKYEDVYLKDYAAPREAREGLAAYFRFYNEERPHQALGYRTPAEAHFAAAGG